MLRHRRYFPSSAKLLVVAAGTIASYLPAPSYHIVAVGGGAMAAATAYIVNWRKYSAVVSLQPRYATEINIDAVLGYEALAESLFGTEINIETVLGYETSIKPRYATEISITLEP